MGYYVRVLTPSSRVVPIEDLSSVLQSAKLVVEGQTNSQWEQLLLTHEDGSEIALLERNEVTSESLGTEEIEEFVEELADARPETNARWVTNYLSEVQVIYAFQILSGVESGEGWRELGAVKARLRDLLGGIYQADGEGFSNEQGYHIIWQFSENVSGPWWMGVQASDGSWTHFQMDLGDARQREQFLRGVVPTGVKLAD